MKLRPQTVTIPLERVFKRMRVQAHKIGDVVEYVGGENRPFKKGSRSVVIDVVPDNGSYQYLTSNGGTFYGYELFNRRRYEALGKRNAGTISIAENRGE